MVDRYTKFILTVIAAALAVLAFEQTISRSKAQSGPTKVQICDSSGISCATLSSSPTSTPPGFSASTLDVKAWR